LVGSFTALLYEPNGKAVIDRLWDETMEELAFAGPLEILNNLRR
jgi:hypothetical protein